MKQPRSSRVFFETVQVLERMYTAVSFTVSERHLPAFFLVHKTGLIALDQPTAERALQRSAGSWNTGHCWRCRYKAVLSPGSVAIDKQGPSRRPIAGGTAFHKKALLGGVPTGRIVAPTLHALELAVVDAQAESADTVGVTPSPPQVAAVLSASASSTGAGKTAGQAGEKVIGRIDAIAGATAFHKKARGGVPTGRIVASALHALELAAVDAQAESADTVGVTSSPPQVAAVLSAASSTGAGKTSGHRAWTASLAASLILVNCGIETYIVNFVVRLPIQPGPVSKSASWPTRSEARRHNPPHLPRARPIIRARSHRRLAVQATSNPACLGDLVLASVLQASVPQLCAGSDAAAASTGADTPPAGGGGSPQELANSPIHLLPKIFEAKES